jgi:CDP-glycerol glycerophosphotransferase (TagB/SpsB family)
MPGPELESFSHFVEEFNKVIDDIDEYEEERNQLRNKIYDYSDSEARKRIVEFIKERM